MKQAGGEAGGEAVDVGDVGRVPTPPPPPAPPLRADPLPPPPLARVELTFEYTFEELEEGLTASPDGKSRKPPISLTKGLLGWALFIVLAIVLFMLLNLSNANRRPRQAPAAPRLDASRYVDIIIAVVPSATAALAAGIFVIATVLATLRLTSKHEKRQKHATVIIVIGLIAIIIVILGGVQLFLSDSLANRWIVRRTAAMVFATAPWALVLIGGIALFMWIIRSNLRRMWHSKPYLRRRRTITLDAVGEQSVDAMATMFYRWPYFRRAFETANMLVLLDESDARHILPKRAMDPMTLDLARAVISNHVADCHFLTIPGGFPVSAPSAPPAVPPPPPLATGGETPTISQASHVENG